MVLRDIPKLMDEATSNLDYITEKTIENTINKFSKNMTTIIIAHRLSTIKDCDKIFVFKDGQCRFVNDVLQN